MTTATLTYNWNQFTSNPPKISEQEPPDARHIIQAVAPPTFSSSNASSSYSVKGTDTITIGDQGKWSLIKKTVSFLVHPSDYLQSAKSPVESLRKAVDDNSQSDFLEIIAYIDVWASSKVLKEAIDLALTANWYQVAVQLAQSGSEDFPEDVVLQKYARVLAPPRVINNRVPTPAGIGDAMDWRKHHGADYRGQWVAIQYGHLVGNAGKRSELKEIVQTLPSQDGVIVMKIPSVL